MVGVFMPFNTELTKGGDVVNVQFPPKTLFANTAVLAAKAVPPPYFISLSLPGWAVAAEAVFPVRIAWAGERSARPGQTTLLATKVANIARRLVAGYRNLCAALVARGGYRVIRRVALPLALFGQTLRRATPVAVDAVVLHAAAFARDGFAAVVASCLHLTFARGEWTAFLKSMFAGSPTEVVFGTAGAPERTYKGRATVGTSNLYRPLVGLVRHVALLVAEVAGTSGNLRRSALKRLAAVGAGDLDSLAKGHNKNLPLAVDRHLSKAHGCQQEGMQTIAGYALPVKPSAFDICIVPQE